MSVRADGRHRCDRCDIDVQGGGVARCVIVSDLDPDRPGQIRNLEFCRDRVEDGDTVRGCDRELLPPRMIKAYTDAQEAPTDG